MQILLQLGSQVGALMSVVSKSRTKLSQGVATADPIVMRQPNIRIDRSQSAERGSDTLLNEVLSTVYQDAMNSGLGDTAIRTIMDLDGLSTQFRTQLFEGFDCLLKKFTVMAELEISQIDVREQLTK